MQISSSVSVAKKLLKTVTEILEDTIDIPEIYAWAEVIHLHFMMLKDDFVYLVICVVNIDWDIYLLTTNVAFTSCHSFI